MPFVNRIGSGATRKFGFGAGMAPGAPTGVSGTRGNQQVTVAFSPPVQIGTGVPTYTATSSPGGFTSSGASSPLVVTGLTNGTPYTFTVTATNPFGSTTSAPSTAVTPASGPGVPGTPTATAGTNQATLSWTAASDNGSAITDYVIQFSSNGGSSWTTFTDAVSATTSATVTGLIAGTAYVFRVAAVNSVATGSYSANSNSVTINGAPNAPTLNSVSAAYSRADLSWSAPTTGFPTSYTYTAYAVASGYATRSATTTGTSVQISSLSTNVTYTFYVTATNTYGTSGNSNSLTEFTDVPCPGGTIIGTATYAGVGTTCNYYQVCNGDGGIGLAYASGGCSVYCPQGAAYGPYCPGCTPACCENAC